MQCFKIQQLKELAFGHIAISGPRYSLDRRGQGNGVAFNKTLITPLSAALEESLKLCLLKSWKLIFWVAYCSTSSSVFLQTFLIVDLTGYSSEKEDTTGHGRKCYLWDVEFGTQQGLFLLSEVKVQSWSFSASIYWMRTCLYLLNILLYALQIWQV